VNAAPGRSGPRCEINVTPLVDVVLVLLIVFMVVTPMLQRGRDVELPVARTADPPGDAAAPVVLSVTADGAIWVDEERCDAERLQARLAEAVRADPPRPFLVKGDARVRVGEVRRALAVVRRAGARGVRVAVDRRAGGEG
jgi:biopolymer transport protein ExbD